MGSPYLASMKSLLSVVVLHLAACAMAQDSLRVEMLLDGGVGRTYFHAEGDEYQFFDTYRTEGNSYAGGVHLRLHVTRHLAVRLGLRGSSRDFRSRTFDYRMPITSQQSVTRRSINSPGWPSFRCHWRRR